MKEVAVNRRDFLKTTAFLGGGLLLSFYIPGCSTRASDDAPFAPNAFLRVSADNTVHVILTKVEMGQGIWTTLATLIAEELDCDWHSLTVAHCPIGKEYRHTFLPMQATVGSSSTVSEFDRYRMAGATARAMLIEAASKSVLSHRKWLCYFR